MMFSGAMSAASRSAMTTTRMVATSVTRPSAMTVFYSGVMTRLAMMGSVVADAQKEVPHEAK